MNFLLLLCGSSSLLKMLLLALLNEGTKNSLEDFEETSLIKLGVSSENPLPQFEKLLTLSKNALFFIEKV